MVACPRCGHQNLPNATTCYKCGTPLPAAAPAPNAPPAFNPPSAPAFNAPAFNPPAAPPAFNPPGAPAAPQAAVPQAPAPGPQPPPAGSPPIDSIEEYARQMAAREAVRKRNRMIIIGVAVVVVGIVAFMQVKDRQRKAAAQEKLAYAERFIELEKRETGAFWNCVMASEVDIGMFQKGEQFQQRIESAYFTQQKTFSDYLSNECIPKIERARQAFGPLTKDAPAELRGPIDQYYETLPKLQTGLEAYAENIKKRGTVKDTDQLIQELGGAWHMTYDPTAESVAYEKFLYCAIPGLAKMKDAQEVLEYMKDQCYAKDPVAFMDRVRKECGSLLVVPDKEAKVDSKSVPKTWKQSHKEGGILEEEMRQMQAWESCSKRSRKGKKKEDLEQFLMAVNDYMAGRTAVANAARKIQESAK